MNIFGIILRQSDLYLLGIIGALGVYLLTSIISRTNAVFVKRREQMAELINDLLAPFNDAIANIELGEHNHIFIMNSIFESQSVSIARAKTVAGKWKKKKIEKAWNKYECFYRANAQGQTTGMFGAVPVNIENKSMKIFQFHMNAIIKTIKKI